MITQVELKDPCPFLPSLSDSIDIEWTEARGRFAVANRPIPAGDQNSDHVIMMTMMIITYRGYLEGATPVLFWSLPAPTAWFLYGFWPAQFLVVVLYVVAFSRSLVTPGDLRRFQEILNTSRAGGTDG